MTVSKMSMNKKDASNSKNDEKDGTGAGKNIWPSFFKMNDNDDEQGASSKDNVTKTSEAQRYKIIIS